MKKPIENDDFAAQAKEAFDDSVERLDAAALSRLNQGRHAALATLASDRPRAAWLRWAPAGGVAAMGAIALLTVLLIRAPEVENIPVEVASDFEILLDGESLEMFENLEFYSWMDDTDLDGDANVG